MKDTKGKYKVKIAPSMLAADFLHLEQSVDIRQQIC